MARVQLNKIHPVPASNIKNPQTIPVIMAAPPRMPTTVVPGTKNISTATSIRPIIIMRRMVVSVIGIIIV
jgi:hypothetical protein